MSLLDVLHKIVDVAAGVGNRQDLHDEIDGLEAPADASSEVPDSAEAEAAPEPEPVPAPEAAPVDDGAQVQEPVQEQVQEVSSSGEAQS